VNDLAECMSWHDVPVEYSEAWRVVFRISQEGLDLTKPCPVCGAQELHRWYLPWYPEEKIVQGQHFVARGSQWQWCAHCCSFEHSSGLVPDWWSCTMSVDVSKLTAYPDELERVRLKFNNQGT